MVSKGKFETGVDCSAKVLYVLKITGQRNKGQIELEEHGLGRVQVYRINLSLTHFLSKTQ